MTHKCVRKKSFYCNCKYSACVPQSHSGQLSGGHYVAYARNPSGAWLCYNDSSCRELSARPALDAGAAYLLFYERRGLHADAYVPRVPADAPHAPRAVPADDDDLGRACVLV